MSKFLTMVTSKVVLPGFDGRTLQYHAVVLVVKHPEPEHRHLNPCWTETLCTLTIWYEYSLV